MELDLMKQHTFQLDLQYSVIKTGRDEIAVKMAEQSLRSQKVMLQRNDLTKAVESRRPG